MKGGGKIKKFFMFGVIPVTFAVLLTVVLLMFAGVNVGESLVKGGTHLPFIGKHLTKAADQPKDYEQKIKQLSVDLVEQKKVVETLQQELKKEEEKRLKAQEVVSQETIATQAEMETKWLDGYRQVAKSLAAMSASKAAPIVSAMDPQEALMIIYTMKNDARSGLLSKLPPDQAAVYATMLQELLQREGQMALLEAASEVRDKYKKTIADLDINRKPKEWADMFRAMQPASAALILTEMDDKKALIILQELDVSTRASILSNLDPKRAGDLSDALVKNS